tara:strand:+ start:128 stop:448 length:321 start_codon:yes stop_codon:yes gene_type:complete
MKKFKVLQIPYVQRNLETEAKFQARRDVLCGDPVEPFLHFYEGVAIITADDLEHVFAVGNIGPNDRIERIAKEMRSVSVGDIIVDMETEERFAVAGFGFNKIEEEE